MASLKTPCWRCRMCLDGRLVHADPVPRRAVGPDPLRATCGSEGSFAVVTSVTLRMHRRPEKRLFMAYRFPNVQAAVAAVFGAARVLPPRVAFAFMTPPRPSRTLARAPSKRANASWS